MASADDRLRALVRFLEDGLEAERTRLARTLHDEMAQDVTALRFGLERLVDGLASGADTGGLARDARAAIELLDDLMRAIRRTMAELRPAVLDQAGLRAALEWRLREFERRTGIATELDGASEPPVSGDQASRIYRIVSDELGRFERGGSAALVCLAVREVAEGDAAPARCVIELTAHEFVPPPEDADQALRALRLEERARELGATATIAQRGSARVLAFAVPRAVGESA
jgi:signal transduction histidine kinase